MSSAGSGVLHLDRAERALPSARAPCSSASAADAGAAEPLHQRGWRRTASRPSPRRKINWRCSPSSSASLTCKPAQGSRPAPSRPDRFARPSPAGARGAAVAAEEFAAVAIDAATGVVHVEERHPVRELGVPRIAGEQRAAGRIRFGDHVHRGLLAQVAEQPFDVAGGAEPARPAGIVAQFQHRELHRGVQRHIDPQLGMDAVLDVFEHAVAEAVAGDV